jgi:hypothetical protein
MDAGMPLQVLTIDKSFSTFLTVKRLFSCMDHHVLPQLASGGELLLAQTADSVSGQS